MFGRRKNRQAIRKRTQRHADKGKKDRKAKSARRNSLLLWRGQIEFYKEFYSNEKQESWMLFERWLYNPEYLNLKENSKFKIGIVHMNILKLSRTTSTEWGDKKKINKKKQKIKINKNINWKFGRKEKKDTGGFADWKEIVNLCLDRQPESQG